jgi:YfiH family protein
MSIQFKREKVHGGWINISRNQNIILGFTELNFDLVNLPLLLPDSSWKILQLTQIHSCRVMLSREISPESRGDGIILTGKGKVAVIKTADCIPLFFWHESNPVGGIVHVGWKGLLGGIEGELIRIIRELDFGLSRFRFYIGPSICRNCYEVGEDLYSGFKNFPERDSIFFPKEGSKYNMDLASGLAISLTRQGISGSAIQLSGLCTHCLENFPSYRRDMPAGRIFNFITLI